MTSAERAKRISQNKAKYGLSQPEIDTLELPKGKKHLSGKSSSEPVLLIQQIMNPKSNFSTVEKIHHLENLKEALNDKLGRVLGVKRKLIGKKKRGLKE